MKPLFFLLFFCTVIVSQAQVSRKGTYASIGIGQFSYNTHWYYHSANGSPYYDNYPDHHNTKTMLLVSVEKKSVFGFTDDSGSGKGLPLLFDLGGELQLGAGGKTKADWLAGEPVISKGGFAAGLNAFIRAGIPIPQKHTNQNLVAFLSLGPGFTMLHNNGKDVEGVATRSTLNYEDGWNEYLIGLHAAVGVTWESGTFAITPELRLFFAGIATAATSWEPYGDVSQQSAPAVFGISVKISKRLRLN